MAIVARESGGNYVPAPAGVHQAVCVDVVDLGTVKSNWQGKDREAHKIALVWEIDEKMEDGRRFTVRRRYTLSLNEKAALRRDLQGWRGRPFTAGELKGFDVEAVLGANCMLNVVQETRDGNTYANVSAIMSLHKGMQKMQPAGDYVRVKNRKSASNTNTIPPTGEDYQSDEDRPVGDEDAPF